MKTPNQEVRDKLIHAAGDPIFRFIAKSQLLTIILMLLSPIIFIWSDIWMFLKVLGSLMIVIIILRFTYYVAYKSVEGIVKDKFPAFFERL